MSKIAPLVILTLAVGLAGPLMAQGLTAAGEPAPPGPPPLRLPSEKTASTLSWATTLTAWALIAVSGGFGEAPSTLSSALAFAGGIAAYVGPSVGGFYGGCWGRGLLLTGLRLGVTVVGMGYALGHDERDNTDVAVIVLGTLVGSAIYECATVRSAVHKRNASRLAKRGPNLAVAPFAMVRGGGLQVRLSF